MSYRVLDNQLSRYSEKLKSELNIKEEDTKKIATRIASEVRWLPQDAKDEILKASPVTIKHRYEELLAFQKWMDIVHESGKNPSVVRAQVIVQNYICFVYLSESCFHVLRKHVSNKSVCKKCCNFLVNNPVRAFRNAIAHSNWCYKDDFSGIIYWARKGSDPNEQLSKFEVNQEDLNFWQARACRVYCVNGLEHKVRRLVVDLRT